MIVLAVPRSAPCAPRVSPATRVSFAPSVPFTPRAPRGSFAPRVSLAPSVAFAPRVPFVPHVAFAALVLLALTGGCVEAPAGPAAPQLGAVLSPTSTAVQTIVGSKQASTAIEVVVAGVTAVVPLDDATQWTAAVRLAEGGNEVVVTAVDAAGRRSASASVVILLDTNAPAPPVVTAPPARTLLDEVALIGTLTPGDLILVNGDVVAVGGGGAFATDRALALGANTIRVASRDLAGNESAVQDFVVERLAELPFTFTPPPAIVNSAAQASFALTGTRELGVEVAIDGVIVVPATDPTGAWLAPVPLVDGANSFALTAALPGEPSSTVAITALVTADLTAPVLTLTAPIDGSLVRTSVALAGTASDTVGQVTVLACIGACTAAGDFVPLTLTAGAFADDLDIRASALAEGQLADVVLRAVDAAGNQSELTTRVLVFRAPLALALPGTSTAVDLAPGAVVGGTVAWSNAAGAVGVARDDDGGGWSPTQTTLATAGASAPRLAPFISGAAGTLAVTHMVWLESGDLMYAGDDGVARLVTAGAIDPITSADVTVDGDNSTGATAFIAFAQGGAVFTTVGSGDVWSTPALVSDAATAAPTDVVTGARGIAVAWIETSDRDGVLDDSDVVVVSLAAALPSAPVLVSADAGAAGLHSTGLGNGDLALAWIDGTGGVVATVDVTAVPVAGVPLVVSNVPGAAIASGIFVEGETVDGDDVLVGFTDSALGFVLRRGPLSALGAHVVVPQGSPPAAPSSPAGFLTGDIAELVWVEGGEALLFVLELP